MKRDYLPLQLPQVADSNTIPNIPLDYDYVLNAPSDDNGVSSSYLVGSIRWTSGRSDTRCNVKRITICNDNPVDYNTACSSYSGDRISLLNNEVTDKTTATPTIKVKRD